MKNCVAKNRRLPGGDAWEIHGTLVIAKDGKITFEPGTSIEGINQVPSTGTTGHFLKKTATGYEFAALPQAAAVAAAAGAAPTKAEYDGLIAALKAAGLMAST